jgi:hypothetical protein
MDLRDLFKQVNPAGAEDEFQSGETSFDSQSQEQFVQEDLASAPEVNNYSSTENVFSSLLKTNKDSEAVSNSYAEIGQIIPTKDEDFFAPPSGMHDLGLSPVAIQDLLLKFLFYQSTASGKELSVKVRLPLHSIVDPMLMKLAEEKFVEVTGSSGLGGHNRNYRLTSTGYKRAEDVLSVTNYVGPAPVSLNDYNEAVSRYSTPVFDIDMLRKAYKDLILDEKAIEQIGPALFSGKSMFLYGPPGTGKTSIAERITKCYSDTIKVPYAVNVQGIPMRFFDYFLHTPVEAVSPGSYPQIKPNEDARWIEIKRPCVIVGPEFTIASSDLQYDPSGPSYQFPSTIKANGGVFVVDDFGRQKENPETILNRWIIPLDRQRDILNMKTGQQVGVPFKIFMVFSTNLDPKELVDEAYLRRLAYKLKVDFPTLETYCLIFANVADKENIKWSDDILDYFIQTFYFKSSRPLRACDPRDIIARVVDICKFNKVKAPYTLTKELVDKACHSYFIS